MNTVTTTYLSKELNVSVFLLADYDWVLVKKRAAMMNDLIADNKT